MNVVQEKTRQRNITPNFLRFKSTIRINLGKNAQMETGKNNQEDKH